MKEGKKRKVKEKETKRHEGNEAMSGQKIPAPLRPSLSCI